MTIPPPPPAEQPPLPTAGTIAPKLATVEPAAPAELTDADLANLEELAVQWHDGDAAIIKGTAIKAEAAEQIRAILPPGQTYIVPGTGVGVAVKRPAGRFDPDTAVAALEAAGVDYNAAVVRTLDSTVLKALLKANGLTNAMAPGKGGGTVVAATGR